MSVIVCTYNRAGKLAACLNALGEANRHGSGQRELLIVDNNSTDRTKDVVSEFAKSGSIEVRYIFEPVQGSSAARNRGLAEARGDLVAITDDDCIVDASWFQEMEKYFADSAVGMAGGRVELYNKEDRPVSVRTSRVRGTLAEPWQAFDIAQGCNIVFRRDVYERIGAFDTRLGPGTRGVAAEDSDFIYRAFCAGFAVHYNPDILVFHDHGRRTAEAEQSLKSAYLRGRCAWYAKCLVAGDRRVLKMLFWELTKESKHAFLRVIGGRAAEIWYLRELVWGLVVGFTIFLSPWALFARRTRR